MGDIRIKIAAAAVCIGLGGLGGFAMASHPAANQAPAALVSSPSSAHSTQPITTGASGAVNTGAATPTPGTPVAVPIAANPKAASNGGPAND